MRDASGVEYAPLLARDFTGLTDSQRCKQRTAGRIGHSCTDLPCQALAQPQPGRRCRRQTLIQRRFDDGSQ